jgi:non-specific serine/threonine protein kinase/serine/threonine-protein kinase PknK
LIDALRAGDRRRLIVIHAPAGYGKTTLAAQWGEELARDGVKVAWLTVDDNDNNLVWFLANLVEAIRRVDPAVARDLGDVLEEYGESAQQYVLTSLIDEIHEGQQPMAVVVDDWHRITAAPVIGAMDFLNEHSCDNMQIVVTSRTRSGLPLSRMRVRDELIEIDVGALCFDVDEARSLLVDVAGLDLQDRDVADLRDSTDGWVAALPRSSATSPAATTPSRISSPRTSSAHWNPRCCDSC